MAGGGDLLGCFGVGFEVQYRNPAGVDASAEPASAVAAGEVLCPAAGAVEGGDDAEAAAEVARGAQGGFGEADNGAAGEFPGGVQARVAEAGDDVAVRSGLFAGRDFGQ